jgi:hypothetical protein
VGRFVTWPTDVDVFVTVEIEREETRLRLDDIPVVISGQTDRFTMAEGSEYVGVTIIGPVSLVERLNTSPIVARVSSAPFLEHSAGQYDVAPDLINLPTGVTIDDPDFPPTLFIIVGDPPVTSLRFTPVPSFVPIALPFELPRIGPR